MNKLMRDIITDMEKIFPSLRQNRSTDYVQLEERLNGLTKFVYYYLDPKPGALSNLADRLHVDKNTLDALLMAVVSKHILEMRFYVNNEEEIEEYFRNSISE